MSNSYVQIFTNSKEYSYRKQSILHYYKESKSGNKSITRDNKQIGGMGSRKGPDLLNQQNNKYDFQKEKKKK